MIQVLEIQNRTVCITEAYITGDASALTISNAFSDDEEDAKYQCCGVSEFGIAMIAESGIWTEIEVMAPHFCQKALCQIQPQATRSKGFPLLRFDGLPDEVTVQDEGDHFTLWFAKGDAIDTIVENDEAQFFISRQRLVGIATPKRRLICSS